MNEHSSNEKSVVLWRSPEEPMEAELDGLRRLLGDFDLVKTESENPEEVFNTALRVNARVIIAGLTGTDLARLFELCRQHGIEIWRTRIVRVKEMTRKPVPHRDYDPRMEDVLEGRKLFFRVYRIYRFDGFHRIVDIKCKKVRRYGLFKDYLCDMEAEIIRVR